MTPGYSGTPLVKKLGLKAGQTLAVFRAPEGYESWLAPLPEGGRIIHNEYDGTPALLHVFEDDAEVLQSLLSFFRSSVKPDTHIWVSWPKKASKVTTDITEDTIRELALPLGYVDIKVCAVSDIWSGLKLVVRKENR